MNWFYTDGAFSIGSSPESLKQPKFISFSTCRTPVQMLVEEETAALSECCASSQLHNCQFLAICFHKSEMSFRLWVRNLWQLSTFFDSFHEFSRRVWLSCMMARRTSRTIPQFHIHMQLSDAMFLSVPWNLTEQWENAQPYHLKVSKATITQEVGKEPSHINFIENMMYPARLAAVKCPAGTN